MGPAQAASTTGVWVGVGVGVTETGARLGIEATMAGAGAGAGAGAARQVLEAPLRQNREQSLALMAAHKGSSTMYSSTMQKSGSRSGVQLVAASTALCSAKEML